ncbi:hypothetical protein JFL43_18625 [Viridibacillus sp. YIM B01967]|uniref:SCP domain-containing protein n=1 Tax=Viridibacillus soli TaxID=2798301 RepID=A0ABS1HBM0_9BACL|nr:CAP domain-containing protein [Viridibacillus soli]MBK3496839.1 hypothetical protein [Viridibacillus soli]
MKKWLLPMSLVMLVSVQAGTVEASYSTKSSDTTKQTQVFQKEWKSYKSNCKIKNHSHKLPNDGNVNTNKPGNNSSGGNTTKPENKPSNDSSNNSAQTAADQFEQKVIELTNVERQKAGLAAFKSDKALMGAAREKSLDMQKNKYFSHTSPTFGSPFDRMKALGIQYSAAGENIAMGQKTPAEVVKAWMDSPGHRANIMSTTFTHIGVGYAATGHYWTQQFIKTK